MEGVPAVCDGVFGYSFASQKQLVAKTKEIWKKTVRLCVAVWGLFRAETDPGPYSILSFHSHRVMCLLK